MKILFAIILLFIPLNGDSFQTDFALKESLLILEAGSARPTNVPHSIYELSRGDYPSALAHLTPEVETQYPWLRDYLANLIEIQKDYIQEESDHFIFVAPPSQRFLFRYAVPSLEKAAHYLHKNFSHRPKEKIRVEIYPSKEAFSHASTLSMETLKRSGAIAICKFHRLMIVSPQALPLGYRWLDALSHEYIHLIINEVSSSKAELWLHEGTARYFDTAYRADPPVFLSPNQKTKLLDAHEENRLIPFKKMSPSLVYLDSQEEVSLAFSQLSHAISVLIRQEGSRSFVRFLKSLRKRSFEQAFFKAYAMTPGEFENKWKDVLLKEKWERTKGAMADEIKFSGLDEDALIGTHNKGKIRLGDRMRLKKRFRAALLQYESALEEEPDNALILLKAARTHLALRQIEPAVQKLKRAVRSNPNYITPYVELAKWVDSKAGLGYLHEAVSLNPFQPDVHLLLGRLYDQEGQAERARWEFNLYERLTNRKPD